MTFSDSIFGWLVWTALTIIIVGLPYYAILIGYAWVLASGNHRRLGAFIATYAVSIVISAWFTASLPGLPVYLCGQATGTSVLAFGRLVYLVVTDRFDTQADPTLPIRQFYAYAIDRLEGPAERTLVSIDAHLKRFIAREQPDRGQRGRHAAPVQSTRSI